MKRFQSQIFLFTALLISSVLFIGCDVDRPTPPRPGSIAAGDDAAENTIPDLQTQTTSTSPSQPPAETTPTDTVVSPEDQPTIVSIQPTLTPQSSGTVNPTTLSTATSTPPPSSQPEQGPEIQSQTPTSLVPTATLPPPVSTTGSERFHVAQQGENLYRIAERYGVSYPELAQLNGIVNADKIYVGQRLRLPANAIVPSDQPTSHRVQPEETLHSIARRYSVEVQALIEVNEIDDPNHIYVGQILTLP